MLKANFLSKKGGKWRAVKLLDIVTLLHNVMEGSRHPDVGFEDARETLNSLTARLNKKVFIDPNVLESALWSCNLLDEKKLFWDVQGRTLDEFLKQVIHGEKFDRFFNVIQNKDVTND